MKYNYEMHIKIHKLKMEWRVALDIFFFLINKNGWKHNLAKTFDAQR